MMDLGQQLLGKKTEWANSPGEPIACCRVQVHTPARGFECRRATSEQPGDDTSKDIARSRGCQPYITFSAYGYFPPPRGNTPGDAASRRSSATDKK
jgi:hypothetical protein